MRTAVLILIGLAVLAAAVWWFWLRPRPPAPEAVVAAYADPLPRPDGGLSVYHLGHSLVGRDMPAMLAQLAGPDHGYHSQLGWGTSLKQHWRGGDAINGFEEMNAHDRFRPAHEAIASGDYNAVVLTEMVELRDAIRYHDSARYFSRWAELARQSGPDVQVYLYETWHNLDDPDGWLSRLDADLPALWEDELLLPAFADAPDRPVRVIPAGQVMAAFARAVEARGGVEGIAGPEDLFSRRDDGSRDTIHLNGLGNYLVALTHYAVLYRTSPVGLPHELRRADGSPASAPSAEAAALMQQVVWDVVTGYPKTGVAP